MRRLLVIVLLMISALAACGNNICESSDAFICEDDCIPKVMVFMDEVVEGTNYSNTCGLEWGLFYYMFNVSCNKEVHVQREGRYKLHEWSNFRHRNGLEMVEKCVPYCNGSIVLPDTKWDILEFSPIEGNNRTTIYYDYKCQSVIGNIYMQQVASNRVNLTAGLFDSDGNFEKAVVTIEYPDLNKSTESMNCSGGVCRAEFEPRGNGTYEFIFETTDNHQELFFYYPEKKACVYAMSTLRQVVSKQKYSYLLNLSIDPCYNFDCPAKCEGDTRLFNGICVDGSCKYIKEDCKNDCLDNSTFREYTCNLRVCSLVRAVPCGDKEYCHQGSCQQKKIDLRECMHNSECYSVSCMEGVCCPVNRTCCVAHSNCTESEYCDLATNLCENKTLSGSKCEWDVKCFSENCRSGICCAEKKNCCEKSDQCGLLMVCDAREYYCTLNPLLYIPIAAIIIGFVWFLIKFQIRIEVRKREFGPYRKKLQKTKRFF